MADSDITLSIPVVSPAVGHNSIAWTATDPHWNGLIYLQLSYVEVWASSSNDRGTAIRVTTGGMTGTVHYGVSEEATLYYWIRPKNNSGQYGAWSPVSPTAGVAGVPLGSNITLSVPVLTPEIGHNNITWTIIDPHWNGLSYTYPVEVWASSSNDRSAASMVATGGLTGTVQYGVSEETTLYYWIRPKNN